MIDINMVVSYYYTGVLGTLPGRGRMTFDLNQGHRGQGQNMRNFTFISRGMVMGVTVQKVVMYLQGQRPVEFVDIECTFEVKGHKSRH